MIPETKLHAVKNAFQENFGISEFQDIREMTAGLTSALVFHIVVKGKPYLLRKNSIWTTTLWEFSMMNL